MRSKKEGIPFPVDAEILETFGIGGSKVTYITEIPVDAIGFELLLKHLQQYPVDIEGVLIAHTLPNTRDNSSPNLRVVLTTDSTRTVPVGMSYLWWLDPTTVPLPYLERYLDILKQYSTFPTVPLIKHDVSMDTWMAPRVQLQRAVKQHRSFLYKGRGYASMSDESREQFLWEVEVCYGWLDECPVVE